MVSTIIRGQLGAGSGKKSFIDPRERMMVKRTQIEISKVKEFMSKIQDASQKGNTELLLVIKEIEKEIAKLEDTKVPCFKGGPFDGPRVHYLLSDTNAKEHKKR